MYSKVRVILVMVGTVLHIFIRNYTPEDLLCT